MNILQRETSLGAFDTHLGPPRIVGTVGETALAGIVRQAEDLQRQRFRSFVAFALPIILVMHLDGTTGGNEMRAG